MIIRTTGSAGGLFTPYKGSFPAFESKDSLIWPPAAIHLLTEPPGLNLVVCFYWLTRKRVYVLF